MNKLLLSMAVCVSAFVSEAAIARWNESYEASDPAIRQWYQEQHNSRGEWCCDKSDGHPYYGDIKINHDGSVIVSRDGKPHTLPAFMVLTNANPTGHAVWWFTQYRDYCFALPSMG